jgi:phytoene synthase
MSSSPSLSPAERKRLQDAYAHAKALHRFHGKSYFFATQLFPRDLREATYALYAFVRVPDEIVDSSPQETPEQRDEVARRLGQWLEDWRDAYARRESGEPVLHAAAHTFHSYGIPFSCSEDFIAAMVQDLEQARYADWDDLKGYMWGSAAVVGIMMSHLIGFRGDQTLDRAATLGYAMQVTNFLRDIDEDFQQRGRVYMPQDELARFGVSDDDIAARRFTPQFREFMQWQVERAHALYEEANDGIPCLDKRGRSAVFAASTLYRAILDKLQDQDFNPFAKRASTSLPEKVWRVGAALKRHPKVWRA